MTTQAMQQMQALAHGQQQQVPVDAGACGGNPAGAYGGGYMAGYGGYGGYGAGITPGCANPYALSTGVAPTFPSYVPPGVVASFKTLGACGVVDSDGNIFRFTGNSTLITNASVINVGGTSVTAVNPDATTSLLGDSFFAPELEDIGDDGEINLTIDDGFATVCSWKWTCTAGIVIERAAAEKDFVDKVLETPADAFNIDGCACPIAFTCITDEESLQLKLRLACPCDEQMDIFVATITGQDPTTDGDFGTGVTNAIAYGLNAQTFAFTLYLNVYETVGTCGVVAPLYNLQPQVAPPQAPMPAMGPCPPGTFQGMMGMGYNGGYNGGGGNGYMQNPALPTRAAR